jgi:RNase P subunit RPR2
MASRFCKNCRNPLIPGQNWYESQKKIYRFFCNPCSSLQRYLHKYGLEVDDVFERLEYQNWKCAICRDPLGRFHVDHDHKTGVVRGFLCSPCNNRNLPVFEGEVEPMKYSKYLDSNANRTPQEISRYRLRASGYSELEIADIDLSSLTEDDVDRLVSNHLDSVLQKMNHRFLGHAGYTGGEISAFGDLSRLTEEDMLTLVESKTKT